MVEKDSKPDDLPRARQVISGRSNLLGRHQKKSHTGGGHHPVDEKWLLSYADMMTLLFGFFVMLYSIAMEEQGNREGVSARLKAILEKAFSSGSSQTSYKDQSSNKNAPQSQSPPFYQPVKENQIENENEKDFKQDLFRQLASNKSAMADPWKAVEQIAIENGKLQSQNHELMEKLQQHNIQMDLKSLKNVQLGKQALQMQTEIKVLGGQLRRQAEISKTSITPLDKEKDLKDMKDQTTQKKPTSEKALHSDQWSVIILAEWATENHDIDLEVRSPAGNWFNAKHKTFPNDGNEFIQDAVSGPGAEAFRAFAKEGDMYEVKVKLYNYKKDLGKVQIELKAILPTGKTKIETVTLTATQREKIIKINPFKLVFDNQENRGPGSKNLP